VNPASAPPARRTAAHRLRRLLPIVIATLVVMLVPLAHGLAAAATVPAPPADVTTPLGPDAPVAVVPYGDVLAAADAKRLNAAVVDTSNYWVAATDRQGNVIAAEIPRLERGTDFARTTDGGAVVPAPEGAADAVPTAFTLAEALRADGVTVISPAAPADEGSSGGSSFMSYLAMPLIFALIGGATIFAFIYFRRRSTGGGGGRPSAASHGRIRKNARVSAPKVRFGDIAGCDEAVEELREIVVFLKEPERFSRVGAKMPRGVILHGPPGTGKTLLAKGVAGESGVPFYALSGSDFVDTFVGVGAARVRDLFAQARENEGGAIIFFDEIDAIGRARGGGAGGADSEREGTLNQLLVELDGFAARDRVVVIAATNRLDTLDQALLRPGRFDRRVQVGLPAERGRLEILRLHSRQIPIADPASLEALAKVTNGFAGADLANLVNEAAIMAARAGRDSVLGGDLDEGMLRAIAGPQRADRRLGDGELEMIAWHEAGHALAAELCPTHATTQRVTILARGDTGGLALYGNQDRALTSQQHLHERMVVAMAGRAAEQIRFGAISSGAANDLEMVNNMARDAVERLGFSAEVGQIISVSGVNQMPLSGETRTAIDREIGRLVDAAYADAVALLTDHRDELDALGAALLAREQLDRDEIDAILATVATGGRSAPTPAGVLPTERIAARVPVTGREPLTSAAPDPVVAVPQPLPPAPTGEDDAGADEAPTVSRPHRRGRRLRVPATRRVRARRPRWAPRSHPRGGRLGRTARAAASTAAAVGKTPTRIAALSLRLRRKRPGIA